MGVIFSDILFPAISMQFTTLVDASLQICVNIFAIFTFIVTHTVCYDFMAAWTSSSLQNHDRLRVFNLIKIL